MFSLSENVMFAWEPADLVMSWHAPRLPKWWGGGEKFIEKSSGGSENVDFKEGLYYGAA